MQTISGTISSDMTIDTSIERIWHVTGSLTVNSGVTLTIEHGVVMKFALNQRLTVNGTLIAIGGATPDSTIYFTSIRDDNAPAPLGDDTNEDGNSTIPDNGDWYYIDFNPSSTGDCHLRHCVIAYGGTGNNGALICDEASPTIGYCHLIAAYYGVACYGESAPILRNTEIDAMTDVPIALEISANPEFDNLVFESTSDNGFDALGLLGGTLTGTNRLSIRGALLGDDPINNFVYIQQSNIDISAGGVLTIQPGVVVKPKTGVDINVEGTLWMDGTADPDSQIVFTSFRDDNYGIPGDTNNDGSITAPAAADWGFISFEEGSTGSVTRSIIKFGGAYPTGGILRTYNTSPVISDLVVGDCEYGIEQGGISASPISNCAISNTGRTPFLMSVSADPVFSNNTFTNVGIAAVGIKGETIGVNSLLKVRTVGGYDNITYWQNGHLTMAVGAHLRIEPGVVLKFREPTASPRLNIEGSMQADAHADSLIVFTSLYDDAYGNPADTEGNGTATTPDDGQWGYITFLPTSVDAQCILDHCIVSYGGQHNSMSYAGAVWCNSASPTITNCEFLTNETGIRTDGNSAPLIANNHFFNNEEVPLATSVVSAPDYVDNTFNQNLYHVVGILQETLAEDAVLEVVRVGGPPDFSEYFPYLHLGTLTIGTGSTLRVEPGVVVKALSHASPYTVNGGLTMDATADSMIVYTSIKDDSFGGDSNVDGSDSSPASGDWREFRYNSSSIDAACILDHCLLRFGGYSNHLINLQSASPTITNCEFEICNSGLWIQNLSDPIVQDNLFRLFNRAPISKSVLANPTFSGNVYDNNAYDCLGLIGEHIAQDLTLARWDLAGYTNITRALIGGSLTIDLGTTLTIEPGVVLKSASIYGNPFSSGIYVEGALVAQGTAEQNIVFTSIMDDAHGNPADTNNNGSMTTPDQRDWTHIEYQDVSDDASNLMEHCLISYGGNSNTGAVKVENASPSFTDSYFDMNYYYGVHITGDSAPVLTDCSFARHTRTPIAMSLISQPVFSGTHFLPDNQYHALGILGETLAQDVTWSRRSMAQTANISYVLLSSLTAGLSSVLTIEPGVVIKIMGSGANITVQRGLIAEGTADPEGLIVFTSVADDFYGGDTNNNGSANNGSNMRWGSIRIQNEAIDSSTRFSNCVFRYSYNSTSYGALDVTNANPQVSHCLFDQNYNGINYHGASGDPSVSQVNDCDFLNSTGYGIKNTGMSFTVNAQNNWWGHATGPYDPSDDTGSGGLYNPDGLGDPVTDMVDYSNWQVDGVQNILLGDVSLNGEIRAYDSSLVLQDLAMLIALTARQELVADVNCSGAHSTLDASLILRFVAGLDSYFPCAYEEVITKGEPVVAERYPGSEPGDFTVSLPRVAIGPDETLNVPVEVAGSGELLGHEYHVIYDPAELVIEEVRLLPAAAGAHLFWNAETVGETGDLRIALASAEFLPVEAAVEVVVRGAAGLPEKQVVQFDLEFARLNEQVVTSSTGIGQSLPEAILLAPNHPNPFNPSTTIEYALPGSIGQGVAVSLRVFDMRGHEVRRLVDEFQAPGRYQVEWDGRDTFGRQVGSGVYFYRLDAGSEQFVHKMMLIK